MRDIYLHLNISKQAHFDALKRQQRCVGLEQSYLGLMAECRKIDPGMGLRTMYAHLKPEGIGRDAFIALGLREGYRLRALSNVTRTTYAVKSSRYPNLLVDHRLMGINQVWVSDLFYFTRFDEHLYVVLIMDVYSRRIVGYACADHMRSELFVEALQGALVLRGISDYEQQLIHHSDRGSQYISEAYTSALEAYNIRISMCQNVLENAHAERVNGTIKNDYLSRYEMSRPAQFPYFVTLSIDSYNVRYHNSLGCSPIDYENNLESIPKSERSEMKIFTYQNSQIADNTGQLDLFSGLTF